MNRAQYISILAQYNESMNVNLYKAAMTLPGEELITNKGAFFGSILGTLNHIAVADTLWLKRFATHPTHFEALQWLADEPTPTSLDQILHADIVSLSAYRSALDKAIVEWAPALTEQDLDHVLHYTSSKGIAGSRRFFGLLMHFFNHQTHHRGQVGTLLSQAGVDVGVTDLMILLPMEPADE